MDSLHLFVLRSPILSNNTLLFNTIESRKIKMTQGGKANLSGNVLESTVEGTLQGHGYIQIGENLPKKNA
ncbi:MAG: hypothetical protein U7127_26595 [Phormidium sp.]